MRLIVFPYKMASGSARALAQELGVKRVYKNRKYTPKEGDVVINWGNSEYPEGWQNAIVINNPHNVAVAHDKLSALEALHRASIRVPEYTTYLDEAESWFHEDEDVVLTRTKLTGSGGKDIIVNIPGEVDDVSSGKVYTRYIKKKAEYRVHVINGNVAHVQHKRKRTDFPEENFSSKIRNYDNGWVFCINEVEPPEDVLTESVLACDALGLTFGAVDVIWNEYHQEATVLEVNTAPGLEGTTVSIYADAFRQILEEAERNEEELNQFLNSPSEETPAPTTPDRAWVDEEAQDLTTYNRAWVDYLRRTAIRHT